LQKAYAELDFQTGTFPVAEKMAAEVLSLPMGPHLSDEASAYVVAQLSAFNPRA
jgi:dTDP-3-amino-3,4,6-trideoxy-alpha-D-glucose transaminase